MQKKKYIDVQNIHSVFDDREQTPIVSKQEFAVGDTVQIQEDNKDDGGSNNVPTTGTDDFVNFQFGEL